VTPPLEHQGTINVVAWSPNGMRLMTASDDKIAQVWDVPRDTGSLADWRAALERSDYRLNDDGMLIVRNWSK